MGPSSPYYLFGAQRRYAYAWHGRPGGVPDQYRASTTRGLSNADMVESGYETGAFFPNVTFNHTQIHSGIPQAISDWPLVRPAGMEPYDPNGDGLGLFDGLSDNEKMLAMVAGAAAVAWFLWKRSKRRRNPARESKRARRLRKLRALSRSSNVHEAALARSRARALARRPRRRRRRRR